jgi:hypothetical protein
VAGQTDLSLSLALDADEQAAVREGLLLALTNNGYSYTEEKAAKRILKRYFPNAVVKRGIPPTYGRDLR